MNCSAEVLQWGHSQTAVETRKHLQRGCGRGACFNGATAKQLWKLVAPEPEPSDDLLLQWGHSQTAVETSYGISLDPRSVGFNGATAKQLWKLLNYLYHDLKETYASMGPQPNSCGNVTNAFCDKVSRPQASMGHSQTAVETRSAERPLNSGSKASMGPQPNSCGNRSTATARRIPLRPLQWGHSQTAVETSETSYVGYTPLIGFNGATAKQLWKLAERGFGSFDFSKLQWGHSQTAVETLGSESRDSANTMSFNGATAKQLWKPATIQERVNA